MLIIILGIIGLVLFMFVTMILSEIKDGLVGLWRYRRNTITIDVPPEYQEAIRQMMDNLKKEREEAKKK